MDCRFVCPFFLVDKLLGQVHYMRIIAQIIQSNDWDILSCSVLPLTTRAVGHCDMPSDGWPVESYGMIENRSSLIRRGL